MSNKEPNHKLFNVDNDTKKRLTGNFFSLIFLQAANYLLPLATLPYLIRVLGVEKYGLLTFAQSIIIFFNIAVDYGFNLSATRDVAVNKNDLDKISEIFCSVMIIKIVMTVVSLVVLCGMLFFINRLTSDWLLYLTTFGMVIGQAIFPVWYFQGIENMKIITILNISSKLFFTIIIFIFIHTPDDYLKVPAFNSLGYLLAGGLSLAIVVAEGKVR